MTAFVLGNGVSRQPVDPVQLARFGRVYGCNRLYQEYQPSVLVATDAAMAKEIQESGYANRHVFYTRRPMSGLGGQTIPVPWFGFSSGPVAAALASAAHAKIYLIGFDLGGSPDGKFNNIYAGTLHYKTIGAQPTYAGNWVKQLIKVSQCHKSVEYVRILGASSGPAPDLEQCANVSTMSITDFLHRINNQKEL